MTPNELDDALFDQLCKIRDRAGNAIKAPGYEAWRAALHQVALGYDPYAEPPMVDGCRQYSLALARAGHDAEQLLALFILTMGVGNDTV